MNPQEFVDRWSHSKLRENQGAQSHFIELCQLVGQLPPAQADPDAKFFTFEENVQKAEGGHGRADVWYKGHFAWEYKGKHKDLEAAYHQLLSYRGDLDNPPLLVVCDFLHYRIYPQFPNTSGKPFEFTNQDLLDPKKLDWLKWLFTHPDKFLELRQAELEAREAVTQKLAGEFAHLADLLRNHKGADGQPLWKPMQIARFLTRVLFILFAEDIDLLPTIEHKSAFRYIIDNAIHYPDRFVPSLRDLFEAMDGRARDFMYQPVRYFNGGLFAPGDDESDHAEVLAIASIPGTMDLLRRVSDASWREVNPTIFGTMFEGALDPGKRAQLGAHYTSEADIRLVLEPVLMLPLNREWEAIRAEAEPLLQAFLSADTPPKGKHQARESLLPLYERMMNRLEKTTVLDPACGSGNFLYMSLRLMKDLEDRVRAFFVPIGLPLRDVVTPRQLYGIEKDEFAAKLAQVVVWIGYLQWQYENNRAALDNLPSPILRDKTSPDEPDHILNDDAIMRYDANGKLYEPDWQAVDIIVGNPPFLGGKRMKSELPNRYVDELFSLFRDRIPAEADLVCYWFEKARAQLESQQAKRIGLLATSSIRGGANREVLKRIKETGDIFMAWSERDWVQGGAAVTVSMVGFDRQGESIKLLDGVPVFAINPDLTGTIDLTTAIRLAENFGISFMGDTKGGKFDIPDTTAQKMLESINPSGKDNRDVLRRWWNGLDVTRRDRNLWIIDFGIDLSENEAAQYFEPFEYIKKHVYPERQTNRRESYKENWWIHVETRRSMRQALAKRPYFIVTPTMSKHRLFVRLSKDVLPDHQLIVFARDDDYFFGILHSYSHEIWALRQGTSLGETPRYTPTTTFETFPLPYPPGSEDTLSPLYQSISAAAKALHEAREAWLNPPDLIAIGATEITLKDRTLTNLYNALVDYRSGKPSSKAGAAAAFAPRLAQLHDALDYAVLCAYGWEDLMGKLRTPEGDEELLRRLLSLNLERAASVTK